MVELIRSAALPRRRRGTAASRLPTSLRCGTMLLRVSRMADDLPQIAELDLSVIARPDGALAVDGRVRIQAAEPVDAFLRQLR